MVYKQTAKELHCTLNDLHYCDELGHLACASDAEVLTFIDLGSSP